MKITVSLPDDLWIRARIMNPTAGPSEIVQRAISQMVRDYKPTLHDLQLYWDNT